MAGKGDKPRKVNVTKYAKNFDQIKWLKIESRKPPKQVKSKLVFTY
jgi:hypothetical protein